MNDELYTAKENAKMHLDKALETYARAAGEYGMGSYDQCAEISDLLYDMKLAWKMISLS